MTDAPVSEETPEAESIAQEPSVPAPEQTASVDSPVEASEHVAPAVPLPSGPPTPAREFLAKQGLLDNLGPLRALNTEMRLEVPQMAELFPAIESDPEALKRFLKFANGGWFNTRIHVDSPYMAYTRFGEEGFYKISLATFLSGVIGDLTTRFRIWRHLERVARIGETIAGSLAPAYSSDLFTAGLLHDAAVPAMQRGLEDYQYFLECVLGLDPVVTSMEHHCHQFDHAKAAGEFAQAAAFDDHIVEAVANHHNESMSAVSPGKARVVLGVLICAKRAISAGRGELKQPFTSATEKVLLREIAASLNVSDGRLLLALNEVVELVKIQEASLG